MGGRGKVIDLGGAKSPCMGCQDRKLHCHNDCEKYKGFRQGKQAYIVAKARYYLQRLWTAKKRSTYNKWAKARDDW